MKFSVIIVLVCLVSFIGALLGVMAYSDNLNRESLRNLFGIRSEAPVEEGPDDLDIYAREIRARQAELEEEERRLEEERRRLAIAQNDLEDLLAQLEETLIAYEETQTTPREQDVLLEEAAATISAMRGRNAARALEEWEPERIAEVLRRMEERNRASILEAMDPEKAGPVLEHLTLDNSY